MIDAEALKEISGKDLIQMELPELQFCIEGILPKGLSILTSASVDCIRSLAMDMSLYVTSGHDQWNAKCQQGAVLHMIHVDALSMTRNRLIDMTKCVPDELYVGVMTEDTLELTVSALPGFMEAHPNASLIVVEMDRPVACVNQRVYVEGDTLLQYSRLKELAAQYNVAVLVVQRSVGRVSELNIRFSHQAVCISDTLDSQFELRPVLRNKNRAALKRSSRIYGNAVWDIAYSCKIHRWELRIRSDQL